MEKKVKKILITSIGGGKIEKNEKNEKKLKNYDNTVYRIEKENGEIYEKSTSYMPLVIEEAYNIDKTIIIGTVGSMWDNIYQIYSEKFGKEIDNKFKEDLIKNELEANIQSAVDKIDIEKFNSFFNRKVIGIITKYGINKKEIFENFDMIIKLKDEFNDDDDYEVYLDITHSFRSNAFWMFLVMTYLTDVTNKKIKISGITYGMYEAKEGKYSSTPIVILKPYLEILSWIKGASELKNYGNSYHILNNDGLDMSIKNELEIFSNTMNMNYIASLIDSIDRLKILENNKKIEEISGVAKHIIPDILKDFISDFDFKTISNKEKRAYLLQAVLAKWHFKQKRYAMAAININEALSNFITNTLNIKNDTNKMDPNSNAKLWLRDLFEHYKKKNDLSKDEKFLKKYGEIYANTREIRNEIAHSLGNRKKIEEDIELLREYTDVIIELLQEDEKIRKIEKKLKLLENEKKNDNKVKTIPKKELNEKPSILILSSRSLTDEEKQELKKKKNWNKLHPINEEDKQRWIRAREKDLEHLKKNVIDENLKEGDYILIHGYFNNMLKISSYANSKKINVVYLSEKYSPGDSYFREL